MHSSPSKSSIEVKSMNRSKKSDSVSSVSSNKTSSGASVRPGAPPPLSGRRKLSAASSMAYLPPMNGVWLDDDDEDTKTKGLFRKKWPHSKKSSDASSSNGGVSPTKSLCSSFSVNNLRPGSELEPIVSYADNSKRHTARSSRFKNLFSPSNDKYPATVSKDMISGPIKFIHTSHVGKENLAISTGRRTSAGISSVDSFNADMHLRQHSSSSSTFSTGSYYNAASSMTPATSSADSSPIREEVIEQNYYVDRTSWENTAPLHLNALRNPRHAIVSDDQTVKKQTSLDSLGWAAPSVDFAEQQRLLLRHCAEPEIPLGEPRRHRRVRPPPFETPISHNSDTLTERDTSVLLPSPLFSHHQRTDSDTKNARTSESPNGWV